VHARLDRDDLEGGWIQTDFRKRRRLHDLHQIRADHQHIVLAKPDAYPQLPEPLGRVQHGAGDVYRLARRLIGQSADRHVESSPRRHAFEPRNRLGIRDRGDQSSGQSLRNDLAQHPGGVARTIAVIGQHDRCLARRHRLPRQCNAIGDRVHLGRGQQRLTPPPCEVRHVIGNPLRQRRIGVGDHLDRHADIRHVRPREAKIQVDIRVRLARLPGQRALHQVHPWRCAGPLHHRRRDDRHFHRGMCWPIGPADRAYQHACRAFALQMAVIMWKILPAEREVGVTQELFVLVAVRIEGGRDEGTRPNCLAHASRQFGFWARNATRRHRSVHTEIDAVKRTLGFDLRGHPADECFVGFLRNPAGSGASPWPKRRFNADEIDAVELACNLNEPSHVGLRS
jgi:hypothetical protein